MGLACSCSAAPPKLLRTCGVLQLGVTNETEVMRRQIEWMRYAQNGLVSWWGTEATDQKPSQGLNPSPVSTHAFHPGRTGRVKPGSGGLHQERLSRDVSKEKGFPSYHLTSAMKLSLFFERRVAASDRVGRANMERPRLY